MLETLSELSILQILAIVFTLIITRWSANGLYRVYFHPLSHFPGPGLSAFTRLPHIYAIATGTVHTYVARLHNKYGDIVRISPDELSFANPHAWRDIYGYGSKENQGSLLSKHFLRYIKPVNGVNSLLTEPNDDEHARLRRVFSPAFSERALTQQAPLFGRYSDQLIDVIDKSITEHQTNMATFDMVRMYNFTTFDIMGDLTFGEALHMLDNVEYDPWLVKLFFEKKMLKMRWTHFNFSAARVAKRLEKGRANKGIDLWDLVLNQQDKGKEVLSKDKMDVNASLFMLAGTETTATLLSGLTYLLLKQPVALNKLVAEIRTSFATSEDISLEAVARLPYLKACINEGLRVYPPVPGGLPRLTPDHGSTICGVWVPPGTTVAVHHRVVYRSSKVFRDACSFVPERWTGDARYAADKRGALQAFSIGSRDCLGKNMAFHEMRLILSKVLYNFDLELVSNDKDWLEQTVFTVWEKGPLMVKVRRAGAA